ncbi:hypothetical protein [Falsibacillus albus]|nr:hypothetical protein [Falsibacillus albus]
MYGYPGFCGPGYPFAYGGALFALGIVLLVLLLIFGGWWFFSGCF